MSGSVAIRLLSTGVPSMMKIAVAHVSIIACDIFCRLSCPGAPKRARAVAANDCCFTARLGMISVFILRDLTDVVVLQDFTAAVVLDAMTVISSSSTSVCII